MYHLAGSQQNGIFGIGARVLSTTGDARVVQLDPAARVEVGSAALEEGGPVADHAHEHAHVDVVECRGEGPVLLGVGGQDGEVPWRCGDGRRIDVSGGDLGLGVL